MATDEQFEADSLQFQTIKNRFASYEARRNKVVANTYQLLRAQVEASFTPSYEDGSYVKPSATVEHNERVGKNDDLWRMWFLDLDQATAALSVSVAVEIGEETKTVNVSGLDASVDYATFLDNFIAGFTSDDIAVAKHCDKCIVLSPKEGVSDFTKIEVTVS